MNFFSGLMIGLVVGGSLGIFAMALLSASKEKDRTLHDDRNDVKNNDTELHKLN